MVGSFCFISFVQIMCEVVEVHFPQAEKIRLVVLPAD